jgi:uncharacterized membrane protein YozB (DUF420 family)
MAVFINRGPWVKVSLLPQNTLWVTFTLVAWIQIKKGRGDKHVKMMCRSYSLAFAAINLHLYIYLLTILGNGIHFANNYIIIAFLSGIPTSFSPKF